MRSTPSRFNAYLAPLDLNLEGRPSTLSVPAMPAASARGDADKSVLEKRYPAVVRALTLLWGHPEMNQYFDKVANGRDPALKLEPAAMAELMLLAEVHRRICPYTPARKVEEVYGPGRWATPWSIASR